jgi:hypothetical protein
MSDQRLPYRVPPEALESPRGYLRRVAFVHSLESVLWLLDLAGLSGPGDLECESRVRPIAYALRMNDDEWRSISYLRCEGNNGFRKRCYFGHVIAADRLNYGRPR